MKLLFMKSNHGRKNFSYEEDFFGARLLNMNEASVATLGSQSLFHGNNKLRAWQPAPNLIRGRTLVLKNSCELLAASHELFLLFVLLNYKLRLDAHSSPLVAH